MNKAAKLMAATLNFIIVQPIWFYLFHSMLKATNASELQLFLFWIYVPAVILCIILTAIVQYATTPPKV